MTKADMITLCGPLLDKFPREFVESLLAEISPHITTSMEGACDSQDTDGRLDSLGMLEYRPSRILSIRRSR
jgi:hypothetical protein